MYPDRVNVTILWMGILWLILWIALLIVSEMLT